MAPRAPLLYHIWFHYIEPFCALNGAYLAYFRPAAYLQMTLAPSFDSTSEVSPATAYVMQQFAAVLVFFGLVEGLMMRMTNDLKVQKVLMLCMFAGDFFYLTALHGQGGSEWYYAQPWLWDGTAWGVFGSSWISLILRCGFLAGVGL
ncbi:hypothetical protein FQN55_006632 [Onygenales sp. PD_40]|nr:hypothetical protein FQN55_006632 [Onygenales sp. PD_40]KAK2777061.1 hypothetical protein FQN52_003245 [Onygenales sp. PD_12]KAK2789453.1 hypothetical protein FQN53_001900 [Emmonsiellopsis sp. PD_33]KAK2795567.1 hypothetical protein FQN51_000421 [Onygenales sp. PD_10]